MKFLLDAHMPLTLAELLSQKGHSCRHIALIGQPGAKDAEIVIEATTHEEVILTHDLDFGTLLAFSGASKPSVLIFRVNPINATIFYQLIIDNWPILEFPLQEGAIIILEQENLRIRSLPIVRKA